MPARCDQNHECLTGEPVPGHRFECGTFQIASRIANHSSAAFSVFSSKSGIRMIMNDTVTTCLKIHVLVFWVKMEATRPPETSISYHIIARRHDPEDFLLESSSPWEHQISLCLKIRQKRLKKSTSNLSMGSLTLTGVQPGACEIKSRALFSGNDEAQNDCKRSHAESQQSKLVAQRTNNGRRIKI
jgi:hypothetical protein